MAVVVVPIWESVVVVAEAVSVHWVSCTLLLCCVWAIIVSLGRTLRAQVLYWNIKNKCNKREGCVDE